MFLILAIAPLLKPPAGVIFFPIFLDYLDEIKLKAIIRKSIPFVISALPFLLWMYYGSIINSSILELILIGTWIQVILKRNPLTNYWFDFNL